MKTSAKIMRLAMGLAIILMCAACGGNSAPNRQSEENSMSKNAKKKNKADKKSAAVKPQTAAAGEKPARVKLTTNFGEIVIELFPKEAPISVENFLAYVRDGFYDGTVFHRVIPNFMIQGGGMNSDLREKADRRAPIKNEADNGLKNLRGTLAMARTQIVDSATSQFFINVKDNSFLDHGARDFGYAVFGKVTAGMEIVDKIAATPTGNSGAYQDVPRSPVIIEKAIIFDE